MRKLPIFMDSHSTTPVDRRVAEAMLPFFSEHFGNAASRTHAFGWRAAEAVERARQQIAAFVGASPTAHKIYGPKGVGALYVRRRTELTPLLFGGGHERGLRSGTLNVPGIVGFGTASALCRQEMKTESERLHALRDRLNAGLHARLDGMLVNGSMTERLSHTLNVSFIGVDGDSLLTGLNDIAVSSGAACTSSTREPSHVLRAIGRDEELARASLRFGICRFNTEAEVDYVVERVASLVTRLREGSAFDEFVDRVADLPSNEYD